MSGNSFDRVMNSVQRLVIPYIPFVIAAGTFGSLYIKGFSAKKELSKNHPSLFSSIDRLSSKSLQERQEALQELISLANEKRQAKITNYLRATMNNYGAMEKILDTLNLCCDITSGIVSLRTQVTEACMYLLFSIVNGKARNKDKLASLGGVDIFGKILFKAPELDHVNAQVKRLALKCIRTYTKFDVENRALDTDIPEGGKFAVLFAKSLDEEKWVMIKSLLAESTNALLLCTLAHLSYTPVGVQKMVDNNLISVLDKHMTKNDSIQTGTQGSKMFKQVALMIVGNIVKVLKEQDLPEAYSKRGLLAHVFTGVTRGRGKLITAAVDFLYFVTNKAVNEGDDEVLEIIATLIFQNPNHSAILFELRELSSTDGGIKYKLDRMADVYTNPEYVPASSEKIKNLLNEVRLALEKRHKQQMQEQMRREQMSMMGMMGGMGGMGGMMPGMGGDDDEQGGMPMNPDFQAMMQALAAGGGY